MVKRTTTRRVDREQAPKYSGTGRVFLQSAQALSTLAGEDEHYGNAIGLLAIHAVISFTDALSIAYGERKSADEHTKAADTLKSILGSRLPEEKAKLLRRVLSEKDAVSYQGKYYPLEDGRRLLGQAEKYREWAQKVLEVRPA